MSDLIRREEVIEAIKPIVATLHLGYHSKFASAINSIPTAKPMEDDYITISREHVKELEEKAKDCEYYRGYINGLEYVLSTIENIFTAGRDNE